MPEPRDTAGIDGALVEIGVVGDLRSDIAQALLLLGELRHLTRWDDQTLCRRLGCDPSRWMELGGDDADQQERLSNSLGFLTLVRDVVDYVDVTADRRQILIAACELSAGTGGPVSRRVTAIRAALEHRQDGLSAYDLLAIGEIGPAWRLAARHVGYGPASERALASERLTSAVAGLVTHIGRERMKVLADRNAAEILGPTVHRRMLEHVQACSTCALAAQDIALPSFVDFPKLGPLAA
jgi:hypothetical protein